MTPSRPLALDTSDDAERRQFAMWREMSPAEKFAAFTQLMALAEAIAEAGIRRLHPAAGAREVFLRQAVRRLGVETALKVYGAEVAAFA